MTKSIFASKTFWVNLISGLVLFAEAQQLTDVLPPGWLPYVAVVVAGLNIILRYITTQPVSMTGTGDGLKVALLAVVLSSTVACGGKPIVIPSTPDVLEGATQDVRAGAIKALGILEASGQVMLRAKAASAKVAIPAPARAELNAAFDAIADRAIAAVNRIEAAAVRDWPALRAELEPILTQVEALARLVQAAAGTGSTLDLVDAALDILRAGLKTIPIGPPTPALAQGGVQ